MHKMLTVARREYNAAVRTKSFLISLFLMPLLMGGGAMPNCCSKVKWTFRRSVLPSSIERRANNSSRL